MQNIKRVPISIFIQELEAALNRHDGYILGAYGQNPKTGSLSLLVTQEASAWKPTGKYYKQYDVGYSSAQKEQALYWREHATRVWDGNGLAAGIYEMQTKLHLNSNVNYNYEFWCDPKSTNMSLLPKEPGIAVFKYNMSAGSIVTVGYLWKPIDTTNPKGDWWIIEANNVLAGVTQSKLSLGNWNRWGKMSKYYDYTENENLISSLDTKEQIKDPLIIKYQSWLFNLGFNVTINGILDDDTKNAIIAFQQDNELPITEKFDIITINLLRTYQQKVLIIKDKCTIRSGPGLAHKVIKIVNAQEKYLYGHMEQNKWRAIIIDNQRYWVPINATKLLT